MKRILLIEDDETFSEAIIYFLEDNGFEVVYFNNATMGLSQSSIENFDLIILDLNLPDLHGNEVCRKIRNNQETPVIVVSANSSIDSKVSLFEYGCNDYLVKPIDPMELLIRINARLKDSLKSNEQTIKRQKIEKIGENFFFEGELLTFTKNEFILFNYLFENKGRRISKDEIISLFDLSPDSRMVDKYILSLRNKIETNPKDPKYIVSNYGQGITFILP